MLLSFGVLFIHHEHKIIKAVDLPFFLVYLIEQISSVICEKLFASLFVAYTAVKFPDELLIAACVEEVLSCTIVHVIHPTNVIDTIISQTDANDKYLYQIPFHALRLYVGHTVGINTEVLSGMINHNL